MKQPTDMQDKIPDNIKPYLQQIAERLHSDHAAVMIGSGFSKNAVRKVNSSTSLPDWKELGNIFYEKSRGKKIEPDEQYLDVLKLAEEVEATVGRPALNQVLKTTIHDDAYDPSELHKDLLKLPWKDVFTTNYDTLLERAKNSDLTRRYDVVVKQSDIVYASSPRIIKLHGSFPSETPFIITREDYRRYPQDFAPFVNTVQQSLLENSLCLLGFSGDDPNFLKWVGWVHDNLGEANMPSIYLVGVLRLSEPQRKLLEKQKIIPVDLSECEGVEGKYYEGLDFFLKYLTDYVKNKDSSTLNWPKKTEMMGPSYRMDGSYPEREKETDALLEEWKERRLSYPGWVIVPEDQCDRLWRQTWAWVSQITEKRDGISLRTLRFAFELNWRMEKCRATIYYNNDELYLHLIERYLHENDIPGEDLDKNGLTLSEVTNMCIQLALSLMRYYREKCRLDEWDKVNQKIESVIKELNDEDKARWYYERALDALFRFNIGELKKRLDAWPIGKSLPFWEVKRASLLIEIGKIKEAERILLQSLTDIRTRLNIVPIKNDYSLVSQESFTMILLQNVKLYLLKFDSYQEIIDEFSERWNILKRYRCDPCGEISKYRFLFEKIQKENTKNKTYNFDIGNFSRKGNVFSGYDEDFLNICRFLHFYEDAGIPYGVGPLSMVPNNAKKMLSSLSKSESHLALIVLLRTGDEKNVEQIHNRESLSELKTSEIDGLIREYLDILKRNMKNIQSDSSVNPWNLKTHFSKIIPEILSRLCCKCSMGSKRDLFEFLLDVYNSPNRGYYGCINHLAERLLQSFPPQERFELIPRIIEIPLPVDEHDMREYPRLVGLLNLNLRIPEKWNKPKISEKRIHEFLKSLDSDKFFIREWNILNLINLKYFCLLKKEDELRFIKLIWKKIDKDGFPAGTNHYKEYFFSHATPKGIDIYALLRRYIENEKLPVLIEPNEKKVVLTHKDDQFFDELSCLQEYIKYDDAVLLLNRFSDWWNEYKDLLDSPKVQRRGDTIFGSVRDRFIGMVSALRNSVVPKFDRNTPNEVIKKLQGLTDDLRKYQLLSLSLEVACLQIYPETKESILDRIKQNLISDNEEVVVESLSAIQLLTTQKKLSKDEWAPILNLLGQRMLWQMRCSLVNTIWAIECIVNESTELFSGDFEQLVLNAIHRIKENSMDDFEYEEWLHVRKRTAGLAYLLSKKYAAGKLPGPIQEWKEICHSEEEFAEIRNQWIEP